MTQSRGWTADQGTPMPTDQRMFMPLEGKETEILLWSIAEIGDVPSRVPEDPSDPLAVLLAAGHARTDILRACAELENSLDSGTITEPLTSIDRDLLRVCIENSSLLEPYRTEKKGLAAENEVKSALRRFATRLEFLGVEINHLPE